MSKTPSIKMVLRMLACRTFKPFDERDWDLFAGCETKAPLISYPTGNETEYTIILDGETVVLVDQGGTELDYYLGGTRGFAKR